MRLQEAVADHKRYVLASNARVTEHALAVAPAARNNQAARAIRGEAKQKIPGKICLGFFCF